MSSIHQMVPVMPSIPLHLYAADGHTMVSKEATARLPEVIEHIIFGYAIDSRDDFDAYIQGFTLPAPSIKEILRGNGSLVSSILGHHESFETVDPARYMQIKSIA